VLAERIAGYFEELAYPNTVVESALTLTGEVAEFPTGGAKVNCANRPPERFLAAKCERIRSLPE